MHFDTAVISEKDGKGQGDKLFPERGKGDLDAQGAIGDGRQFANSIGDFDDAQPIDPNRANGWLVG
jgi:hypothetical protein